MCRHQQQEGKNMAVHKKTAGAGTSQSNQDSNDMSLGDLLPIKAVRSLVSGFTINLGSFDQNEIVHERLEVGALLDLMLLGNHPALNGGAFTIDGNSNVEWANVASHLSSCCLEMCFDFLTVMVAQSTLVVVTAMEMPVTWSKWAHCRRLTANWSYTFTTNPWLCIQCWCF